MDGGDLHAVLDDRIDMRDLLARKRRETSMKGRVLLTAAEIAAADKPRTCAGATILGTGAEACPARA
jgi:hypothetical protein